MGEAGRAEFVMRYSEEVNYAELMRIYGHARCLALSRQRSRAK
jgi:hypothetical protein